LGSVLEKALERGIALKASFQSQTNTCKLRKNHNGVNKLTMQTLTKHTCNKKS